MSLCSDGAHCRCARIRTSTVYPWPCHSLSARSVLRIARVQGRYIGAGSVALSPSLPLSASFPPSSFALLPTCVGHPVRVPPVWTSLGYARASLYCSRDHIETSTQRTRESAVTSSCSACVTSARPLFASSRRLHRVRSVGSCSSMVRVLSSALLPPFPHSKIVALGKNWNQVVSVLALIFQTLLL
jgi:hypothetical protein